MTEFTIERLGHQGDGIAAGPIFIPLTLPGERVEVVLNESRAENLKILEPSEDRVKAPCKHFRSCGGCQLQHASDSFVARWKVEIVEQALAAQGISAEMRPILTSPVHSRRRAIFSARRTKKGAMAGFHARASDVICEISECQLVHLDLLDALDAARALAIVGGSRKGELSVTATTTENGLDLSVAGGKPVDGPLQALLAQEAERLKLARLAWDGDVIAARLPASQKFGRALVETPSGAFLQATSEGEAALLQSVRDAIEGSGKKGIDLFAGCGTFTLPLAEDFEMRAVEGDGDMLEALDRGWRMTPGLKSVVTETRDLFRQPLLPDELNYGFAVIDPPRAGAAAQVAEMARSSLTRIAFVSCNPVTFARDVSVLVDAGFSVDWVQVVDQFRWSSHVELVARLSRS